MKKIAAIILTISLFTGCKNEVASMNEEDNPSPAAAATPAAPAVANALSNHALNVAMMTAGSVENSSVFAKLESMFKGDLFKGKKPRETHEISSEDQEEFKREAKDALLELFQNQRTLEMAEEWLETSPGTDFCQEITSKEEDLKGCSELVQHLIFRINLSSETSGTIVGFFDQQEFIQLNFKEDELRIKLTLSAVPVIFSTIKEIWKGYGVAIDLPDLHFANGTITGTAFWGVDKKSLNLAITDEVNISGEHDKNLVLVHADQDSSVSLETDPLNSTTTLDLNVKNFQVTDQFKFIIQNRLTGKIIFDELNQEVRSENLTIDNLSITDSDEPLNLTLNPVTGTIIFHDDGITLHHHGEFSFFLGLTDGSTSWTANTGSLIIRGFDQPWIRAGTPLNMFNTGVFGNGALLVPAGKCFNLKPWQVVDCNP